MSSIAIASLTMIADTIIEIKVLVGVPVSKSANEKK